MGMLVMSCAVVIDGFFIGNHAGPVALASVNLTIPLTGLLFGIAMMFSVGGAARCGKYLGAGKTNAANNIFTQTVVVTIFIMLAASVLGILFMDKLVIALGANHTLHKTVAEYLTIILAFHIFSMGVVCLSYFLRLDNRPYMAAGAMTLGSLLNILLDWIFVAKLQMGHKGAALGTGLSEMVAFTIMLTPFVFNKTRLRFIWSKNRISETLKAAWNGFSELSNELSAGILIFIFNWLIMEQMGEKGVAAFSVINYILLCGFLINYGISDSLQPMVSKNFGACNPKRIRSFLMISTMTVLLAGTAISILLKISPTTVIGFFMEKGEQKTINLTVHFLSRIWPVFLLSGLNIVLSSYLTAMHRALPSTLIAVCRSLVFPVLFLALIRTLTEYKGILIVLPLSEIFTFGFALYLLHKNSPAKLTRKDQRIRTKATEREFAPCLASRC